MEEDRKVMEEERTRLELDHAIGYTGHFANTCLCHPTKSNTIVYNTGTVLVVSDTSSVPHKQQFIHGHDAEISAMCLSKSGKFLASGQLGSSKIAGDVAPVLVWDLERLTNVYVFDILKYEINSLSFSPDDRFLAAVSRNVCVIWDMEVGEMVTSKTLQKNINLMTWGRVTEDSRSSRCSYKLHLACSSQVIMNSLDYDVATMRYVLRSEFATMPTGGLVRSYTSSIVPLQGGLFLLAGTENGEVCVFNTKHRIFRASVTAAKNGVRTMCCSETDDTCLYIGAGDGTVTHFCGTDCHWKAQRSARVQGKVMSLSVRADGKSLLVGTSRGTMYEIELDTFTPKILLSSHVDSINAVVFPKNLSTTTETAMTSCERCCTASNDGTIQIWDLSNYESILRIQEASEATCLSLVQRGDQMLIFSGWRDCSIRVYDASKGGDIVFYIPNAHRKPVSSIDVTDKYFVSAGEDGIVNVWSWSRELLCQFSEHRSKPVRSVRVDVKFPYMLHSCAEDGQVLSYDLRKERRVKSQFQKRKRYNAMTQRKDSENELLVTTTCGKIQAWDSDYDTPVMTIEDTQSSLNCMSLSSSGRFLAVAGDDGLVKIYELVVVKAASSEKQQPVLIAIGDGHFTRVVDLSWAPDERQLISVADNCSMCVWNFFG